jgi:hypothetical protein
MRKDHLENNLQKSHYTIDLYKQYRKHLGPLRYKLLREGQVLVVPPIVRRLLRLKKVSLLSPVLSIYKFSRLLQLDWFLKSLVLPAEYKKRIKSLDIIPS